MQSTRNSKQLTDFENDTGKIDYTLLNDIVFHFVFENNDDILRHLLCSLLHLKPSDIESIEVKNPIHYGELPLDKKMILDLSLILNSSEIINLELQVLNEGDWPERSLSYLCRSFNTLNSGEEYIDVMPSHFIGILNFTPFKNAPEFYSTYHLSNDKTGALYTGKFALSVLDLTQINLATKEDKEWGIDKWAALFKAKTWEELRMISSSDKELEKTASLIHFANKDEIEREWAWMHEEALRRERARNARYRKKDEYYARKDEEFARKDEEFARKDEEFARKDEEFAHKNEELAHKNEELAMLRKLLSENNITPPSM